MNKSNGLQLLHILECSVCPALMRGLLIMIAGGLLGGLQRRRDAFYFILFLRAAF